MKNQKQSTDSTNGEQFDGVPPRHCLPPSNPQVQLQGCIPGLAVTRAELDLCVTFETSGKSPSHVALWVLSCKPGRTSSAAAVHSVNSLPCVYTASWHNDTVIQAGPWGRQYNPYFGVFLPSPAQSIVGNDSILLSLLVLLLFWEWDACCVRTGVEQVPETAAKSCGFINLSPSRGVQGTLPHLFMC